MVYVAAPGRRRLRTLGECKAASLTLHAYCPSCEARTPPAPICKAFDGWRVEELERAGAVACSVCGRSGCGVAVVGALWGMGVDYEVWYGDVGSVRGQTDGMQR